MSQEIHKHYHINILPQNSAAWLFIAFGAVLVALNWGFSKAEVAKAEAEKAKYETQGRLTK